MDAPCLLEVDRTDGADLVFSYDVPYEDTELTADELTDSRTLRFVLLAEPLGPAERLPNWLTREDVERARSAGLVADDVPSTDVASETWADRLIVLDTPPRQLGCDENRIISVDTSTLEVGAYDLWAQTFEPPQNLWTRYPGMVVVHDGERPPAITVHTLDPSSPESDPTTLRVLGCGTEGSTVRIGIIDSTASDFDQDDSWTSLSESTVDDRQVDLTVRVPPEFDGRGAYVRVEVERGGTLEGAGVLGPVAFVPGSTGVHPVDVVGVCGPTEAFPADSAEPSEQTGGCSLDRGGEAIAWFVPLLVLGLRRTPDPHSATSHRGTAP